MKTKLEKKTAILLFITIVAFFLVGSFSVVLVTDAEGISVKPECKVAVHENSPYYCETTYYYDKDLFVAETSVDMAQVITQQSGIRYSDAKAMTQNMTEKEFVVGVSKKMIVEEARDDDGTIDSKLLTWNETEQKSIVAASDTIYIGSDKARRYDLTIDMFVLYGNTQTYGVYAAAKWEPLSTDGEFTVEGTSDDYLAVSWGGNKQLEGINDNFQAYYKRTDNTTFTMSTDARSKLLADSYTGFCWQFRERAIVNTERVYVENVSYFVELEKVNSTFFDMETNVKLTYIHTWEANRLNLEWGIGYPPSLSIKNNTSDKFWQVQIDVPGIKY